MPMRFIGVLESGVSHARQMLGKYSGNRNPGLSSGLHWRRVKGVEETESGFVQSAHIFQTNISHSSSFVGFRR